jgi:hypothetical protein
MKNHFSSLTIICILAAFASCKKKTDIDYMFPNKPTSANGVGSRDDLAALLKSAVNKPETFTVNATTGGEFTSSKGITYTIDPGIFVKPNGETAQGDVQVTVKEITEASEMILNDMPTNAVTSPEDSVFNPKDSTFTQDTTTKADVGGMLESFGELKVDAKQGEENLELKPDAEIKVEIPQTALPEPITMVSSPVWSAGIVTKSSLKGYDYENNPVNDFTNVTELVSTGFTWKETPYIAPVYVESGIPTIYCEIPKLNVFYNVDLLVPVTRTTTVLGYFNNVFNEIDSTDSFEGIQSNMLFFKEKDKNGAYKLYNNILNAPAGKKGLMSYQNTFGIGMEGTFLALCIKDGKFYVHKKSVTIGEPEAGKNFVGINFNLQEVSEAQMFALIDSMNDE